MWRKLQSNRYEMKYLITESQAREIRDFASCYAVHDEYFRGGIGYTVCSLYVDSPELKLYRQTVEGKRNRFKLRIRFYDNEPSSPAFLEIKRRENILVRKKRATVGREAILRFLAGDQLRPCDLFYAQAAASLEADALEEFCRLNRHIRGVGSTYVLYTREAYVSPGGNSFRVTFDRGIKTSPFNLRDNRLEVPTCAKPANVPLVVLELKFTDRFPGWMRLLVDDFNLQKTSVPKYVESVDALHLANPCPSFA
jgi:hypothetical protein